ncbi:IQ domain-containing protein E isoform X1 [Cricetulus griseus]|uniref:IQ domain-containing protein E n=1 Tax=Cricetulus griseus TaxID=10029 RepID=A0A9J7JLI1_CRIGR|nr:IQ domain-containing protein E isoform X1 [Cricetulus griseus]XP_027269321.1 IQ domain-containing protein E isoform X3 [Cricetulus griseus]
MATLGTPAHWTTPLQPLSSEWTTPLQPLSAENPFGLLKLQLGGWLQEREPPLRAGSPGFNSCIKRNRNSSGEKVRLRSTTPGERMVGPAPGLTLRARAQDSPSIRGMSTSGALRPPHGCHDSGVAGRLPTLRADLPSPRTPRSAATMSQGTADLASETGDDSLSAITFDSDFETKTKRKGFHKPPSTSPKSPYYSKPKKVTSWRSLKTAGSMPLSSRISLTPQKLWLGTSKHGSMTQPLSSMVTSEHAWIHPPSCTPDHLTEAVRAKRADPRRSGNHGHISGNSVYREKEDMYDEIIELKKSLHMQKSDVDLMRTKLRRLEEENNRKDRQIEQLLDPGRGPDFVRTLAEKRPDTGWVITGLKQRIFKLEQQCKEKDNTINKLQTDMKTTNLEEMRIAMETYYEEIHRLQTLLASTDASGKKPIMEKKLGVKRQKKMSSALLNLTRSVQELTEENQSLKEDLDRMLSNSPTVSKIKGYVDWSKPRLLRRIAELEKKVSSAESPKPSASELVKPNPLVSSSSNISVQKQPKGDQPKEDLPKEDSSEDQEHLRGALKVLKGERSVLQAQLLEKDEEMNKLLQAKMDLEKELEMAREGEKERQEQERALREKIEALTSKCQELEEAKRQERDLTVAVTQEAPPELHAPSPCSDHSKPDSDNEPSEHNSDSQEAESQPPTPCSEERRDAAIRILQAQWKAHRHKKRKAALDEAATVLQAAFRGHLARSRLLRSKAPASRSPSLLDLPSIPTELQRSPTPRVPSPISPPEDSPEQEEAITVIQSILRGYLAQARFIANCCRGIAASQKGAVSAMPSESTSPPSLAASPGAIRVGLSPKEELRETAAIEPAPSRPSVPNSPQSGHWDSPPPCDLEAVPQSSVKDVICLDVCDERSSSAASTQPSLVASSPGLPPMSPPPVEDVCSDDSDDIIFSPFLPRKKSPSPF